MDPDIAWSTLVDIARPFAERCSAAVDLIAWLQRGGYAPAGCQDRAQVIGYCTGFLDAVSAVRHLPEVAQLRIDLVHIDKNTHHLVYSAMRLLEALHD